MPYLSRGDDSIGSWDLLCLSKEAIPTDLEWELAVRGVDGRIYPWGNRFDKTRQCRRAAREGRSFTVSETCRRVSIRSESLRAAGHCRKRRRLGCERVRCLSTRVHGCNLSFQPRGRNSLSAASSYRSRLSCARDHCALSSRTRSAVVEFSKKSLNCLFRPGDSMTVA